MTTTACAIGPQVPSTSSRDYGEPFAAIFKRYNHDFYAVDPHLFSPAEVVFNNLETGCVHAFGELGRGRARPLFHLLTPGPFSDFPFPTHDQTGGSGIRHGLARSGPATGGAMLAVDFEAIPFPRVVGRLGTGRERLEAGGIDLTRVGGVLVRMMPPGSLEQVVFRMDALHRLQAMGIPVLNPPRAIETAVDKYLALALLAASDLPVPPTWSGESAADWAGGVRALGGDVVVKPLFGSEGRGLVRVSHPELARRTFQTLERLGAVLHVQARSAIPATTSASLSWATAYSARSAAMLPKANGARTWPSAAVPSPV